MQTQTTEGYGRTGDDGQEVYYSLARLRKQFQDYLFQKANEIEEQKEARRYFHCVQWTREQMKTIRERGQPVTTTNEYARKVNAIVGVLERLKQDPKAMPNTPQHADGADLGTETLRYAMNSQHWDSIQPFVSRCGAVDGIGGVEFDLEQGDMGDPEVGLATVQPDTFFYDPRSYEQDFSDALFMGTSKWVDKEVLKDMFPDKADEIDSVADSGADFETGSDREIVWTNSSEQMVRAVDHWYYCKGKWKWCFHIGNLKLAEGISPWIDEKGKTTHKFEMYSAAVDHEGDRYGFLRNLKSAQDEVNQRKSRMLHISNSRRLILKKSAVKDVEKARKEWARADGVVVLNENAEYGKDIIKDDTAQDFAGQLQIYQEAKAELDRFGPNATQLGQGDAGKSGRAIALLQQAGLAELGPFILAYRDWKFRVYRKMWNAIQRQWQTERWIRVTDSEGLTQFIQLNGLTIDQFGRPALVNALGSLDVDITLDESGDVVTTMAEALETLQSALAAGMPIPPDILVDLLPIRQDIKKRLKERMEQAQQPDPMEQQAKQVALDQETAKTEKTRAEVGKVKADAFKSTAQAVTAIASSPLGMGGIDGLPGMEQSAPQPSPQMPATSATPLPTPAMSGNSMPMGVGGGQPDFSRLLEMQAAMPPPQAQMPVQQSFGF
jgi:hypothetical protein